MKLLRSVRFVAAALTILAVAARPGYAAPQAKGAEEEEKDTWNVEEPPGPSRDIPLDTRTGTWMSLDVSPDGREIVFDLLGDLYVLPIHGGEALALTHGVSWDMQPRYSPDGKWIAFTSDRGGGDNIWVIGRGGNGARQVTKEDYRLLNSPAWSPDSQFLAARKHFTSRRSLGAGEIWLYHASGEKTGGLQMTEKPNEQKDVGEPAFSPDGRYVYYSRDNTPGDYFEYDKNPHAEIYAIFRLDRETGRIERFISGAGGSVRPVPSPDGKQVAFVRRVRLATGLFVSDVESGAERMLWDGLERDNQETWAIHGVYPNFAWLPDASALVVWAQGRIWHVDAATGEPREIPFHVTDERTVYEPVRFPLEVAPPTFDAKLVRWPEVSPSGDAVVYGALGKLWIKDLPDGEARRLTSDDAHLEYYPTWSRDGRSIAYVSWDDQELSAVRIVPRTGGEGRAVTSRPGHYVQPSFSPDGSQLVFVRERGEGLTSPNWSREPGIYRISVAGGDAQRVARSGVRPHFGARADRIFYMDWEDKDERVLKVVGLGGKDERVLLRSEAATEFRVSPDDRWVAFCERFHAYVSPFPPTGREVSIGPKQEAVPQTRVSEKAAEFVRWSPDGTRLTWGSGPELFSRQLAETFTFAEGARQPLPEPPTSGVPLGITLESDVPDGAIALVGARLVTMRGDEVIEDGTIVVERNRITAIGPTAGVSVPDGAHVVDASGHTILPGLIDVHAHGPQGEHGMQPQQNWLHYSMLSFGVTTIHDPSNDTHDIFTSSEMQKAGRITAPRLYSTGTILYGASGSYRAEIENKDDARFHLERLKAVGAFSVKSYNQPRREQRQQVIAAARELRMEVMPEGGALFQHNMTMIVDGHTGIEHSVPVPAVYDDVIQLWSSTPVGYTPTFVVAYGGLGGQNYWLQHTEVFENERLLTFVPRERIDRTAVRRQHASDGDWNHIRIARGAKALYDAGVQVHIGAHGEREGLAAHWEIWSLVQGGMTPHEALRCATLYGARYIGAERDLGSLDVGKLADLIVLDANPLDDVQNSESVHWTMVNGRLYDARTMDEVGNRPRPRGPFFWE